MLAGFSKLFDKAYAVGFLLPVLLGMAVVAWLFPGWPLTRPLAQLDASQEALGKLLYLGLVVYGGSIVLTMLNLPIYRLIEGYGPIWKRFPSLVRRQALARARLARKRNRLRRAWDAVPDEQRVRSEIGRRLGDIERDLLARFPPEDYPVLPTRFGNVLRAFEAYPLANYGADGVAMWPRLISVMGKDFVAGLEDAQAQVNCLVNLMVLAGGVGLVCIGNGLWATPWDFLAAGLHRRVFVHVLLACTPNHRFWIGVALLGVVAPLYWWAIDRAIAWGEIVKAAFDCYLPQLCKQLGFVLPSSDRDRRRFWADVSALVIYWQPMDQGPWRAVDAPPPQRFAQRHGP